MANLNNMPVEIIEKICLEFDPPDRYALSVEESPEARKALAALCRSSKTLHQIASPHLYRRIHILAHESLITPFIKTLLKNQHLAQLVREIDIEQTPGLQRDYTLECHLASQQPDFLAGETVELDGSIGGSNDWYAIRSFDLLLSTLRNIEYLGIDIRDGCYRDDCFTYIRDKHLDDTEFLPRLKEVFVYNEHGELRFGSITALLSVTPVQKMRVKNCFDVFELDNFPLPLLLELRLGEIQLTNNQLVRLVKFCPNLQLFCYEKDTTLKYWDGNYERATTTGVSLAIRHLKKRLQTVSLHFIAYDEPEEPTELSMDSFAEFSKLRSLKIQMYALADRILDDGEPENEDEDEDEDEDRTIALRPWLHKLPGSLEHLCITDGSKLLGPELAKLASRAEDFPKLRTLIVCGSIGCQALFRDTNIEYIEPGHPRYAECSKDIMWD